MEIRKCHIIIAKIIHCLSHKFIAKKCRITFYVSINMLLFQKIPHDIFNFLRRTSVHCGKCDRIADFCRDRLDIFFCHMFKKTDMLQKPLFAFFEDCRISVIFQPFNKVINLFVFDALKVVATGHVELESVRTSKSEFFCDHMNKYPAFNILCHCLRYIKFRRPFTVVRFIFCHDTWLRDACRKLRSIHFLYSF